MNELQKQLDELAAICGRHGIITEQAKRELHMLVCNAHVAGHNFAVRNSRAAEPEEE